MAVAGGSSAIVRLCKKHSADFRGVLSFAVRYHRHNFFDRFISDSRANEADPSGLAPLHHACDANNARAIARLSCHADANARSPRGRPLDIAISRGHLEAIARLLSAPSIDVSARDASGFTPLALAARHGATRAAKLLIAHGAAASDALVGAASVGANAIALPLAQDPVVDVNCSLADGWTALAYAVQQGNVKLFEAIMSRSDVNVNVRTGSGLTLLHAAARDWRMLRALLARGVIDVNAVQASGATALHMAAAVGNVEAVSMLLEQSGIDPNVCDEHTGTPLQVAILRRNEEVAIRLIEFCETDVNKRSERWAAPINLAIIGKMISCVRALCARVDLCVAGDVTRKRAWPPLVVAADAACAEAVEILLAHPQVRADDDACGRLFARGIAVTRGFRECLRLLKRSVGREAIGNTDSDSEGKAWKMELMTKPIRRRRRSSSVV
jgi:ankyrin repeat protein